jgi:hypothetical protein
MAPQNALAAPTCEIEILEGDAALESELQDHPEVTDRQLLSYQTRVNAADTQTLSRHPYTVPADNTPDEVAHFDGTFAGSFTKLLRHDKTTGLLTAQGKADYGRLLDGLLVNHPEDELSSDFCSKSLNAITLSDTPIQRVFVNPRSSKALSIEGGDICSFHVARITGRYASTADLLEKISLTSAMTAAEMIEVYGMVLLRDVALADFTTAGLAGNPDAQLVLNALNDASVIDAFTGPKNAAGQVTADTLFRGGGHSDTDGPYLSAFFQLKRGPLFPSGCEGPVATLIGADQFFDPFGHQFTVPEPNANGNEFAATWDDYVALQNGSIPKKYAKTDFNISPGGAGIRTLVKTGRHLGAWTNLDGPYEEYLFAVNVLTSTNHPLSPKFPYAVPPATPGAYKNEGGGPTLGPQEAYALIGGVLTEALKAVFTQKWLVGRRGRPERLGALVHQALTAGGAVPAWNEINDILKNPTPNVQALLDRVRARNKSRAGGAPASDTYLLPLLFPEGSPAHPAWPSAHATIAGACVTVIKAIFDDSLPMTLPDGSQTGPLHVELDKLASNIALARNFAGVHYRSDGEDGIRLGEAVAIRYLQDRTRIYREVFIGDRGFQLHNRDGEQILITRREVVPAAAMAAPAAVPRLRDERFCNGYTGRASVVSIAKRAGGCSVRCTGRVRTPFEDSGRATLTRITRSTEYQPDAFGATEIREMRLKRWQAIFCH